MHTGLTITTYVTDMVATMATNTTVLAFGPRLGNMFIYGTIYVYATIRKGFLPCTAFTCRALVITTHAATNGTTTNGIPRSIVVMHGGMDIRTDYVTLIVMSYVVCI